MNKVKVFIVVELDGALKKCAQMERLTEQAELVEKVFLKMVSEEKKKIFQTIFFPQVLHKISPKGILQECKKECLCSLKLTRPCNLDQFQVNVWVW